MTINTPQRLLALSIAAGLAPVTFAETLEPVTVTASRFEQPVTQTVSPVTVITREIIEQGQYSSVDEVLRTVPGVTIANSGGRGQTQAVYLRGAPRARHALVLVDGVRLAAPNSGAPSLEYLSLEQIDRIEVVRGPRSSLYGSDAMGGIIQIFTRDRTEPETNLSLSAGSFGYVKGSAANTLPIGRDTVINTSISYEQEDGFDVRPDADDDSPDGYNLTDASVSVRHSLSAQTALRAGWRMNLGTTEFDSGNEGDQTDYLNQTIHAGVDHHWGTVQSALDVSYAHNNGVTYHDDLDKSDGDEFVGTRISLNNVNRVDVTDSLDLTLGLDVMRDDVSGTDVSYYTGGGYDTDTRDTLGVFGGGTFEGGSWIADGSARLHADDQFGEAVTYSLGYKQFLTNSISANAGYGTAYAVPSFDELYAPNFGNPDLEPERSATVELGLAYNSARLNANVTAFRTDYEDRIAGFPPANQAEATVNGVELGGDYTTDFGLFSQVSLDVYDAEDGEGDRVIRIPEYSFKASAVQSLGTISLGTRLLAEGSRKDLNDADVDGYYTVDTFGSYETQAGVVVGARVNNIMDADYQTVDGYDTAGRNYLVTLRYTL